MPPYKGLYGPEPGSKDTTKAIERAFDKMEGEERAPITRLGQQLIAAAKERCPTVPFGHRMALEVLGKLGILIHQEMEKEELRQLREDCPLGFLTEGLKGNGP